MKASRRLTRRSFVASVLGGAALGGSATALITGRAQAQNMRYSGVTDSDTGEHADRPGYGVGTRNQYTDRDTGPNADPQFHGRGPNGRPEGSVSGQGSYGDAPSGCSDNDSGPGSDPGGRGRRCNGQTPLQRYPPGHTRHCTDSDRGGGADPVQQGVRC
jgi:hypothetical protein